MKKKKIKKIKIEYDRITRIEYFLSRIIILYTGFFLLLIIVISGNYIIEHNIMSEEITALITIILGLILFIIYLIYSIKFAIKRLHDLGRSGIHSIWFAVPTVGLILGILLLFLKGNDGQNNYGINSAIYRERNFYKPKLDVERDKSRESIN